MGSRWSSARRCCVTLTSFLDKLEHGCRAQEQFPVREPASVIDRAYLADYSQSGQVNSVSTPMSEAPYRSKRPRTHDYVDLNTEWQGNSSSNRAPNNRLDANSLDSYLWQPVLQYRGPDFGFDSSQLATNWRGSELPNMNGLSEPAGLYDLAGWDAYMQNWGNSFN
jgi:hypothetical protein